MLRANRPFVRAGDLGVEHDDAQAAEPLRVVVLLYGVRRLVVQHHGAERAALVVVAEAEKHG